MAWEVSWCNACPFKASDCSRLVYQGLVPFNRMHVSIGAALTRRASQTLRSPRSSLGSSEPCQELLNDRCYHNIFEERQAASSLAVQSAQLRVITLIDSARYQQDAPSFQEFLADHLHTQLVDHSG